MIAVDTNVIVRFLVRDDEKQARAVYERLRRAELSRESLFVPLLVLLETVWVLGSAYGKTRAEVLDSIEDLRRMPVFRFENDAAVAGWLSDGRQCGADLADILMAHAARSCGCEAVVTFDKGAARLPFFRVLQSATTG